MKRFAMLALVIPMIILGACSAPRAPSSNVERSGGFITYDDQLAQVAEEMKGFGGMFFDDQGALNVYLTRRDLSAQAVTTEELEDAIAGVFGEDVLLTPRRRGSSLETQATKAEIKVLTGQFDIPTLIEVREHADTTLALPGVVFTDLDEARNRVLIAVENDAAREQVERTLDKLGVLRSTFIIEETEPIKPLKGVQDRFRPALGGIQIDPDGKGYCTLGFNAIRSGVRGFVTNSHCTNVMGGTEGTVFYQHYGPTPAADNVLGYETVDPPYYTGGWPFKCPSGRRCRFSDSAFVRYAGTASSSLARIARTEGLDSLTIDSKRPTFTIVNEKSPVVGQHLNKVGRTTGWTYGVVSHTCLNANFEVNDDIILICQVRFARPAADYPNYPLVAPGDSGGPVFAYGGNDNVSLYGIIWGGEGIYGFFSPMVNIEGELGQLTTTPTWAP